MSFDNLIEKYYALQDYNCAETLLHAANEYYALNLNEEDMRMMAGFGGGMFVGATCGALVGSVAAISKMVVETKAHETKNIKSIISTCVQNFTDTFSSMDCSQIKPVFHTQETKCLQTCLLAGQALQKTIKEEDIQ